MSELCHQLYDSFSQHYFLAFKFIYFSIDKPGPPVGPIRIDEIDSNYVTISWEPPELDGGATLSGYVVEQRDAHRPGWLPVSESVTRTTYKFTRLVEGAEYVFRVAATNRFGIGSYLQSEIIECKSRIRKSTFKNIKIYMYMGLCSHTKIQFSRCNYLFFQTVYIIMHSSLVILPGSNAIHKPVQVL